MANHLSLTISRRQLLLGTGSLSLLGAAYATLPQLGSYSVPSIPLSSLTPKEAAIYRSIGNWLIPEGGALPGSGGDDTTLAGIDSMLDGLPEGRRWLLAALPMVFEHGTALDRFGAARLTSLPESGASAYLMEWAASPSLVPAQLMAAVKAIYGFAYFERPEVLAAMHIAPHCGAVQ
jgi:hypothetical protein